FNWAFLGRFLLNITFLFGLIEPGKTSHLPGGWSIGIEWVFYLAFPLFVMFAQTLRTMFVLLFLALVINQLYVSALFGDGKTLGDEWVAYIQFPVFLVYFIAGIASAEMYLRLGALPKPNPWLCRVVPLLCLVLI